MIQKIKALWASLPHGVQSLILGAATVAGTTFVHAVGEGNCYSAACLKRYAATSLIAGLAVVKAFYMLPHGTDQLVAQAKAQIAEAKAAEVPPQKS